MTDEAKGSFGETFHSKTVVRTGVLGINYWIEVRMEREEEHLGRQMEGNTQSGSLKHYLRDKYGQKTQRMVDAYGKERERRARFSNHHLFILRCYKSGIIPTGLRMITPVNTERAHVAARRASRVFTQERIKTTMKQRDSAAARVKTIKHELSSTLSEDDFNKIEKLCQRGEEATFERFKERQRKKFDNLRENFGRFDADNKRIDHRPSWIVNLSDRKLSKEEESLLVKGPKFAVTPKLNKMDIIAPVEAALQTSKATDQEKELARIRSCETLKKAKKPTNNLTKEEQTARKNLESDKKIKILQADKGNATVVMSTEAYQTKACKLLNDQTAYTVLAKDPTRTSERKLLTMLRTLKKTGKMNEKTYEEIRPSEGSSKPALFYGQVKIHKPDAPLRPVVATRGTATYELARHLSRIFRPLVSSSERVLKNTEDLVEVFKDVKLKKDEILVSFDVKSLFTSIPIEEAISVCESRLNEDTTLKTRTDLSVQTIIQLLRFCLTSITFQYDGKHYQQKDGLAMGSPVSPVIADLFMIDLENRTFSSCTNVTLPRKWFRFVDDVISIIKKTDTELFLEHLNSQNEKISFTMESEKDGSLPYMDVLFTRQTDGTLKRKVFQKPTHTNRYVQFDSHHPISTKRGVITGLVNRAVQICSDQQLLNEELSRIQNVMESNGYPRGFVKRTIKRQIKKKTGVKLPKEDEKAEKMVNASIPFIEGLSQEVRRIAQAAGVKCTFRTANTLRSVYSAKDRLPKDTQTHCIYSLKCGTCEDEYVGETLRAIGVRAKEHRDAVSIGDHKKSALAEHVLSYKKPHEINWRSLSVVDKATNMKERKVREAFHIQKRKPGLNRDKGVEKSTTWDAILNT